MPDIKSELRRGRYYVGHIASIDETDVCTRAADRIEDLEDALRSALAGDFEWKKIAKRELLAGVDDKSA